MYLIGSVNIATSKRGIIMSDQLFGKIVVVILLGLALAYAEALSSLLNQLN